MNKVLIVLVLIIIIFISTKIMSNDKQLSKNFTLFEFTKDGKFKPTKEVEKNIESLVINVLQPLRDYFGRPILVTSGFRPEYYNTQIGGSETSEHIIGSASDIKIEGVSNEQILQAVVTLKLPVNQLIDENKKTEKGLVQWVHISHNRNRQNKGSILYAENKSIGAPMEYKKIGVV